MSFVPFVKKVSASVKNSSRPSTSDQVKTSRIKTAFGSIRRKIHPAKNWDTSHGNVLPIEGTDDEGAIVGGSAQEEPRRSDLDAIAGANASNFEQPPVVLSTIESSTHSWERTSIEPTTPLSIPAQDGAESRSEIASVLATAPPSLNGVAAGICTILTQSEQTSPNKDDVWKLTSRIEALIGSLSDSCDESEKQRRMTLKTKLDKGFLVLDSMMQQESLSDQRGVLSWFTKEIGDAITDYQIALQQAIYNKAVESGDMAWLDRLSHTKDASHLAGTRRRCLPGTRTELLQAIEAWVNDPEALRVYWLNGLAGMGKSTIAQSIAERTSQMWLLGASFFCSRDFEATRELSRIFPTLAFQLACRYPGFRSHLIDAIKSSPDVARHSLSDQFRKLLLEPLKASNLKTTIIIDALDECIDNEPASAILSVLSQYIDQLPSVKFFITGRPEAQINAGFRIRSLRPHTEIMILHKIETSLVDRDVATYFQTRFLELVETRTDLDTADGWPDPQDIATLVRKSSGLFIYAETTFRFITSKHKNPQKQLHLIVNSPESGVNLALLHVDNLYTQILQLGFVDVDPNSPDGIFEQFRTIVGSIVLLFDPLSINDVALLLDLQPLDISTCLLSLNSLLFVPDRNSDLVRIIHKSFPDYITDPTRCRDENFCIDPATNHAVMVLRCLVLMRKRLRKNICHLPRYAKNDEVEDLAARKIQYIGSALEYACRFWTGHLKQAARVDKETIDSIVTALTEFFKHNSLPWLEVLSIIGKLAVAIHALQVINQWLSALDCDAQEARDLAEDCMRFALQYFDSIQQSSQHIYRSGLPLCPTSSLIWTLYQQDHGTEVKIMCGIGHEWGSCMRTMHIGKAVYAVTISQRGDMIGVGDASGRCHIFEAASGSVVTVCETSGYVCSVAFSADGSLFASGDSGGNIMIWDVQTGIRKLLFCGGKENSVSSVSFSPKETLLASGTDDGKGRIWDVSSEEPLKFTLEGHTKSIGVVCWSDDGSKVLSGSDDGSMKVWDSSTGHGLHTIQIENEIYCVAWSPDGSKIGLSTEGRIITYNARTYERLGSFTVNDGCYTLDFSPKRDHLVYHSGTSVHVRNLNLDVDISRFVGHSAKILSVAFSSGGNTIVTSGGGDMLVKIWRFRPRSEEKVPDREPESSSFPYEVTFSPNGQLIATATTDEREVKLWDAMTCSHIVSLYLDRKQAEIFPHLAFSPDSSLIGCGFTGKDSMRIWDVNTRAVVSDFHGVELCRFCFSPDGARIAMFGDRRIQLWDVRQANLVAEVTWLEYILGEIAFFEDGSGIHITCWSGPLILLDIIPSSDQSLPFEFVASSRENPLLFLMHREYASYKVADKMDWILDTMNRSVFSIPPDQRPDFSRSWDAHGTKIAWCGNKGLVLLDFAHISTNTSIDIDNTD